MKIIALLENFPQTQSGTSYHYGRYVLNDHFLRAILNYSSLDEIHFFVDDIMCGRKSLGQFKRKNFYKKIKIFPIHLFSEKLSQFSYLAIHTNMFMLLGGIAEIRNKVKPRLPITALTATVTYPFYDNEFFLISHKLKSWDAVIVPSDSSRQYIDRFCNQISSSSNLSLNIKFRIEKIPYGVTSPGKIISKKLHGQIIKILIFNRISNYDKCDLLPFMSLFKQIIDKATCKVKIIIAGDCNNTHYLNKILEEINHFNLDKNIDIIPSPSEKKKKCLFKQADIFLALSDSLQESLGIVLLEAASYSLPIIATDWDGYREVVRNGKNGFLIKTFKLKDSSDYFFNQRNLAIFPFPHAISYWKHDLSLNSQVTFIDNQTFLDKTLTLIKNSALRNKMSQESFRVAQNYDWQRIIAKYELLWKKLSREKIRDTEEQKWLFGITPDIFDPFYSQIIDDAVIKINSKDINRLCHSLSNYMDLAGLLEKNIIKQILSELSNGELSIKELILQLKAPKEKILFNISWLLKNNFLVLK